MPGVRAVSDLDQRVRGVLQGRADAASLAGEIDTMAAAYALQDRLVDAVGPTCGWKVAANTPALMQAFGITEPIVARITGAPLADGATLSLGDYRHLALEPEIVAVLARDVTEPLGEADADAAVESYRAGFEILDRRGYADPPHGPSFVAYNIFNQGVVLGPETLPRDALSGDALAAAGARFDLGGVCLLDGTGTAPEPPARTVRFVVNTALSRGQPVRAGQVILCGTHHPPAPVEAAGAASFSLAGCRVSLSISA